MDLKILFVEDHDDTRNILAHLLSHFGYRVQPAGTYSDALKFLGSTQFDVLLSDVGLPDGDGCDLVSRAKRIQPLIAIALTAYNSPTDTHRGINSGFDHYLSKPLDVSALRTLLANVAG